MTFLDAARAIDASLLQVSGQVRYTVIAVTVLHMIAVAIPSVPRAYVDYARVPLLSGVQQHEHTTTVTIGPCTSPRSC